MSLKIYNEINVGNYILDSLLRIEKNDFDMFYVLSIKPSNGTKLDQAGYFHFPALFKGLYRKNTEKWNYLICSQKLPNEEELINAKAIIIPGSHISINDDYDFLRKTEKWIKDFHQNHPDVKFLGICFGMQIFITSLGGKVEKLKNTEFELGPKKIEISENFWNLNFVKQSKLEKKDAYYMMQAHRDECTIIPMESKLKHYGKSLNCYNEIMICEDERIFLVQGHPEYIPIFNIERMAPLRLIMEKKEKTLENILEQREKDISQMGGDIHSIEYRRLCYTFLKCKGNFI
jgi:GMP synthase-like glutamine amidotransferase